MACKDGHKFAPLGPPIEYVPFIIADRFNGTSPAAYMDLRVDYRSRILEIMSLEGEIQRTWNEANEGAAPGTSVIITEWEYDIWPDD